jgi:type IV pilus assembly protein PilA
MNGTLRRLRKRRAEGDSGFTLVELLVVVVIIGVLVAIAIPAYLNYRKGAENKSAESDVRGAAVAIEQFFTENSNTYPATGKVTGGVPLILGTTTSGPAATGGTPQTINVSPSNSLSYVKGTATGASYWVCGQNANGLTIYVYNNSTGGSVKKSAGANLAACEGNGL